MFQKVLRSIFLVASYGFLWIEADLANRSVQTKKIPVTKADGSLFVCLCGSKEFRVKDEPLHLFCRCGKVYTAKDLES